MPPLKNKNSAVSGTRPSRKQGWGHFWTRLLWVVPIVGGCAWNVVAPEAPRDPVAVYLVDYGHHARLLLPAKDNELIEYSFGDWYYYAKGETCVFSGLRALFRSPQSTLGRRIIRTDDRDKGSLVRKLRGERVSCVRVERQAVERLAAALNQRYLKNSHTEIYNEAHEAHFVKDEHSYHLLRNSNFVLAKWLEELGCSTRGHPILPNFEVANPCPGF